MKKVRYSTLWLTYTGVLIALQIVLGNLVQVALLEKQMNLGFLPIAAAGYLFGPVSAMIVAALGDVLGTLILGTGAYFPGFTLTALIVGCLYGLFMYPRNQKWLTAALKNHVADIAVRALISAALAAAVYIFLNSYWITFIVPKGYLVLLLGRLPFNLAEIPIFTVLITVTCLALDRLPTNVLPSRAVQGKPVDTDKSVGA
jgi:ECF transporter S component (folate family)